MNSFLFEVGFVFKAHIFCCFYLTGLIWTIQAVHYPAYHFIDLNRFKDYQAYHMKWITPVVAPFMIIEASTGLILLLSQPNSLFWQANLVGIALIWVTTFFFSVPAHNKLVDTYNFKATNKLIRTNWARTLIWSIRSVALFYYWVVSL